MLSLHFRVMYIYTNSPFFDYLENRVFCKWTKQAKYTPCGDLTIIHNLYNSEKMTAIKHALQRDIFTPNDERLLSIVNVCKAGKKKRNCFLCATGMCVWSMGKDFHTVLLTMLYTEIDFFPKLAVDLSSLLHSYLSVVHIVDKINILS